MPSVAAPGRRSRVIVLNGVPCSGKTTLARAFQADVDQPWLGIDLDVFTPRLPPRSTWSEPTVLKRIVAGGNAAVAAVAAAGNDIVLELVARRDPGASFVLDDLFARLANYDVLVVCLQCSLESAMRREAARSTESDSLVERDYGNVDEECCDVVIDTDAFSIAEQVIHLRRALSIGPTGGLARLRTNLRRRARATDWGSLAGD